MAVTANDDVARLTRAHAPSRRAARIPRDDDRSRSATVDTRDEPKAELKKPRVSKMAYGPAASSSPSRMRANEAGASSSTVDIATPKVAIRIVTRRTTLWRAANWRPIQIVAGTVPTTPPNDGRDRPGRS